MADDRNSRSGDAAPDLLKRLLDRAAASPVRCCAMCGSEMTDRLLTCTRCATREFRRAVARGWLTLDEVPEKFRRAVQQAASGDGSRQGQAGSQRP
jgi:hypothetical protein